MFNDKNFIKGDSPKYHSFCNAQYGVKVGINNAVATPKEMASAN